MMVKGRSSSITDVPIALRLPENRDRHSRSLMTATDTSSRRNVRPRSGREPSTSNKSRSETTAVTRSAPDGVWRLRVPGAYSPSDSNELLSRRSASRSSRCIVCRNLYNSIGRGKRRSGCGFDHAKSAAVAPVASARLSTATIVTTGFFTNVRAPNLASRAISSRRHLCTHL